MGRSLWQCLLLASWALWWGGLTFYGLVAVPEGVEVIGLTTEGFVTQRVTRWLNRIATALIALLLVNTMRGWRSGRQWRGLTLTLLVMAGAQIGLFVLHPMLDRMLNPDEQTILEPERFHFLHETYLWITTVQWVAGLAHLWFIVVNKPDTFRSPKNSGTLAPAEMDGVR